ncbi:MAG: hypothetical protein AAF215_35130, partial [Cyanobacteria bacterium P01_A01_bin.123]
TVLVSSILFGSAGFWLMPGQAKGAITGAAAGAAVAAGHVQQDRRLRHLMAKQQKINNAHQIKVNSLTAVTAQNRKNVEKVFLASKQHQTRLTELRDGSHSSQPALNSDEINGIQTKLAELELKINRNSVSPDDNISNDADRIETASRELENQANLTTEPALPGNDQETFNNIEEPATTDQEEILEDKTAQRVLEWFKGKNIKVQNYYEPDPKIDGLLDELSLYLGDNYAILKGFHRKLRSSVGKRTRFDLRDYDARAKRIHNQYIKKLKSCDYLLNGRLIKNKESSDFIIADSYNRPDIQGFFDGGWFERFIYDKVVELFDSEGVDYQYLRNPKIAYENGDLSELDLFFLVNGKPLLIECKAGQQYHAGIEKFNTHGQRLDLNSDNAIFVVLDIDEAEAHIRTHHWDITVADQNNFLDRIKSLIETHGASQSLVDNGEEEEEAGKEAAAASDDDSLETFFKKGNLNLAPESRKFVFNELIKLFKGLDGSTISFNDITKSLRDSVQTESNLSRRKVNEILNCLRCADLFRDAQKKPVRNTSEPIAQIASLRSKIFEKKCMEFYAGRILHLFDPDFFEEPENITVFESLTLGSAPSLERVRYLKERQVNMRDATSNGDDEQT